MTPPSSAPSRRGPAARPARCVAGACAVAGRRWLPARPSARAGRRPAARATAGQAACTGTLQRTPARPAPCRAGWPGPPPARAAAGLSLRCGRQRQLWPSSARRPRPGVQGAPGSIRPGFRERTPASGPARRRAGRRAPRSGSRSSGCSALSPAAGPSGRRRRRPRRPAVQRGGALRRDAQREVAFFGNALLAAHQPGGVQLARRVCVPRERRGRWCSGTGSSTVPS